eukprot:scaffold34134_cov31-Tisochrysis_lutea.AAC.2
MGARTADGGGLERVTPEMVAGRHSKSGGYRGAQGPERRASHRCISRQSGSGSLGDACTSALPGILHGRRPTDHGPHRPTHHRTTSIRRCAHALASASTFISCTSPFDVLAVPATLALR